MTPGRSASRIAAARRRLPRLAATALLVASGAIIGLVTDFDGPLAPLSGINAWLYDASVALAGRLDPAGAPVAWPRAAVVLMDDASLALAPWSSVPRVLQQPEFGALAQQLLDLGAAKVGFDLVPAVVPQAWRLPFARLDAYDESWRRLLESRRDRLVLGTAATAPLAPDYAALLGPRGIGAIDLQAERDGIIRSVAVRLRLAPGRDTLGFAAALALGQTPHLVLGGRRLLVPRAPIALLPHLTVAQLASCAATEAGRASLTHLLAGRTIVVGAALEGEDVHRGPDGWMGPAPQPAGADPCGGAAEPIPGLARGHLPGPFLQAAAADMLIGGTDARLADPWLRAAAGAACVGFGLLGQTVLRGRLRRPGRVSRPFAVTAHAALVLLLGTVLFLATVVAAAAVALRLFGLWLPLGLAALIVPAAGALGSLVAALRADLRLADLRFAFGRWLPGPVVEATLADGPPAFGGEERVISVLFADLRQFSIFCAGHRDSPGVIVSALNHRFALAQAEIDRTGGCLDKFDGDAIIAFWNAVETQPDHAMRALSAARAIAALRPQDAHGTALRFKVSVATGLAFVGCYGSGQKINFSAIGEPMNLAARLETLCGPHGLDLVVSEPTVASLPAEARAALGLERLGTAALKGFAEPVPFYSAARPGPAAQSLPIRLEGSPLAGGPGLC